MTTKTNIEAVALKPCPFCGCATSPELKGNGIGDNWLECVECGASTRLREDGTGSAKDWNRRAPASPSGEDAAEQSAAPMAGPKDGFDVALDALHEYQSNWDTGLPAEYASQERIAMECAVEAVREALQDARSASHAPLSSDELIEHTAREIELSRASEQADEVVTDVERRIPDGWRLYSADFSVSGSPGSVTLIRDEQGKAWWHGLTDEEHEKIDLFITGRGKTIREAIDAARAKDSK